MVDIQRCSLREIQRQATLITMFSLRQVLPFFKFYLRVGPWPPLPYTPLGDGKERDFGYKSEPSLREGGWCDNLLSGVRVNEERKNRIKYVYLH